MAGTGLVAIKRRIKSITNTKKITSAMGLVATSKYKKVREQIDSNNSYINKLQEVVKQVSGNYEESNIFINGNSTSKKMYLILTSDSGLCGGFNWSVVNVLVDDIKAEKEDYSVIVVGQKGRAMLKKLNIETIAEYVEIPEMPSQKDSAIIAENILNMYGSQEIGEVYIVYKKFVSTMKNEVKIEKVLPLGLDNEEDSNKEYVELEAMDEKAIYEITSLFLSGKIQNSMLHSRASEHRARMESMGAATNNANDLLEKLKLKYNRIRQSAITQEISEIVGGAEAQR